MFLWVRRFIHNCIVHPTIQFMPNKMAHSFHNWNANWTWDDNIDIWEPKEEHILRYTQLEDSIDIRSRLCKNCMYCNMRGDSFGICAIKASPTTGKTVPYTYGCNRFKLKDK